MKDAFILLLWLLVLSPLHALAHRLGANPFCLPVLWDGRAVDECRLCGRRTPR